MRPIDRGDWPQDFSGLNIDYSDPPENNYKNAKDELFNRLGKYCSYCERPVSALLHLEHVIPKTHAPELCGDWSNFILGCVNCNSTKLTQNNTREGYLWPDTHNTFEVFEYDSSGRVNIHPELAPSLIQSVNNLYTLVGLNKPFRYDRKRKDDRIFDRRQAWKIAEETREGFEKETYSIDSHYVKNALNLAKATGFFSVWITVFKDYPEIRQRLVEAFPGTKREYFNSP